jgi:cellulose biosynthesis protein BcsQ
MNATVKTDKETQMNEAVINNVSANGNANDSVSANDSANTNAEANRVKTKKIIAIYNIKGGVGKSTIARELAYKLNATLVDCDRRGVQEFMESVKTVSLGEDMEIPLDVEGDVVIYDFPGKDDVRREEIARKSALVIIPYTPTFYSLQSTADSYKQIWRENINAVMVANMLKEDKDLERTKGELEEFLNQDMIILPLHYTRGLQSAENRGKSIYELRSESPINRQIYAKVCRELDAIVEIAEGILSDAETY